MKLLSKFFLAGALMLPASISFAAAGDPCVKTNYDGKVVFEGTTNYSGVCERTTEQSNSKFFKGKNYSSSIEIKYSRPIWTSKDNKIDCCTDAGKKARLASYKSCMAKSEKTSEWEREGDCATACVSIGGITVLSFGKLYQHHEFDPNKPKQTHWGESFGCRSSSWCDEELHSTQPSVREIDAKEILLSVGDVATGSRNAVDIEIFKNVLLVASANETLYNDYSYFKVLWDYTNSDIDCYDYGSEGSISSFNDQGATYTITPRTRCTEYSSAALRIVMFNETSGFENGIFSLTPKIDEHCVPSKVRWQAGHEGHLRFEGTVWRDIYMLEAATTYRAKGIVDEFAPALGLNTEHNPIRIGYGYSTESESESESEKRTRLLEAHIVKE